MTTEPNSVSFIEFADFINVNKGNVLVNNLSNTRKKITTAVRELNVYQLIYVIPLNV